MADRVVHCFIDRCGTVPIVYIFAIYFELKRRIHDCPKVCNRNDLCELVALWVGACHTHALQMPIRGSQYQLDAMYALALFGVILPPLFSPVQRYRTQGIQQMLHQMLANIFCSVCVLHDMDGMFATFG